MGNLSHKQYAASTNAIRGRDLVDSFCGCKRPQAPCEGRSPQ
jgi:hypothetical protein